MAVLSTTSMPPTLTISGSRIRAITSGSAIGSPSGGIASIGERSTTARTALAP
jgi:hypothetical protein